MRPTHSHSLISSLLLASSFSISNAASLEKRALTVPTKLPGKWAYKGCWTDVGRTINDAGYADAVGMTIESCISFCVGKGLQWAGVEYSQECYCGATPAATAAQVGASECNTACKGNATEPCGGGGRLSLFYSSVPVGPQPNPGPPGWTYLGCYTEGTGGRALTYTPAGLNAATMSVANCTTACKTAGYKLAGVEYGGECYCGNTWSNGATSTTSGCNVLCNGNQTEYCGGGNRLNAYGYGVTLSSTSTTTSTSSSTSRTSTATTTGTSTSTGSRSTTSTSTSASSTPTAPYQPATVGTWKWYGCQTEGTNLRALSSTTTASDTMTLESCATFCAGYSYFGIEYARECYCGNSFSAGSVPAGASECSMTCSGNQWNFCGAGNRLSVYSANGATQSLSSTSTRTSTGTSSTSSTPAATGLPAGWTSQGCWIDGPNGRILDHQEPDSQTLTPQSCAAACYNLGYTISGTEWAQQCFCGNNIVNGGTNTTASDCNVPCSGDSKQMCGAGGRMSIVSKGTPTVKLPPAVQTGGLNGTWAYQGCYEDNVNQQRTFFWQLYFHNTMTATQCLSRCAQYGYMAAGLEYGDECYCGDPANIVTQNATKRPESECNVLCAGNSSAYCGGGSRLSTYFYTGTPPYSWTFPQTPATAGRYDLLIGGVTIPLMTMESITGKITFMSKWGTGPANETGAYELDLASISNPAKAWRPLHLKTDVFCSAGLILPDKAGRQINLGGWSGDSTEGVRLYWPDGSPGVWGTHDFQENVAELKLVKGRWYPSAMIMANGSILVMGGEEGSNGAAVPSIEVLPATGGGAITMDWLARTNPNNLYPFPAVLPGGGIFVAYYNEARILNAATFATTKILPNAPGAVNDDSGGRTYPLEGTAVLLPQKGPNYDNLGVLICGGSTNGVSNALDNCVSMYPEATNPTWTLERMPSPRVMPCMAPLPDGTYFIANGAHHGVAGFGLATGPNLNAMNYNPTKPIGSRITVWANTTIPRLYHSEAITLLDGRVLISGSDPEDAVNPQEYRVEVFSPPYLLNGKTRPTFAITNKDWTYGATISFTYTAAGNGALSVTLLGAVSSTHGNSMGARVLQPAATCSGGTCTFKAPPNANTAPPGWYQLFFLDGGIPAVGTYVRIGGDPAKLGNWPTFTDFIKPGV